MTAARVIVVAIAALLSACSTTRLVRPPPTDCSPVALAERIFCGDALVATVACEGRGLAGTCRALSVVYASGQRVNLYEAPGFDEWPNHPRPGDKTDHVLGYTAFAVSPDGRGVRYLHRALLGSSWREYEVFTGRTRDARAPERNQQDEDPPRP